MSPMDTGLCLIGGVGQKDPQRLGKVMLLFDVQENFMSCHVMSKVLNVGRMSCSFGQPLKHEVSLTAIIFMEYILC